MYVSSVTVLGVISIHALREEGDDGNMDEFGHIGEFQSTPSARRATIPDREHTLLLHHFNPRPPRGGRPQAAVQPIRESLFQSTPSARRATDYFTLSERAVVFQSTPSARRATL